MLWLWSSTFLNSPVRLSQNLILGVVIYSLMYRPLTDDFSDYSKHLNIVSYVIHLFRTEFARYH